MIRKVPSSVPDATRLCAVPSIKSESIIAKSILRINFNPFRSFSPSKKHPTLINSKIIIKIKNIISPSSFIWATTHLLIFASCYPVVEETTITATYFLMLNCTETNTLISIRISVLNELLIIYKSDR